MVVSPVCVNANYPSYIDENKKKDPVDRVAEAGIEGFKLTTKVTKLAKKVVKVADLFAHIPGEIDEVFIAIKSFAIIKGMLAIPKLFKSAIKVVTATDLKSKLMAGWKTIKSVKKIVGAVETVFYYLKKLDLISKASVAWTTVTGYIFMPLSFIGAGISAYELTEKALFLKSFRGRIKVAKAQEHAATAVCNEILASQKKLKEFKVITKECPLKDRLKAILTKLKSRNAKARKAAEAETTLIQKRLKDRISEHVGVAAINTSLSVAGCASTVISLACPPAAVGLTIAGLAMTVIGLATFAYSKFIPQGDILETEQRMLFSRLFKGARHLSASIQNLLPQAASAA